MSEDTSASSTTDVQTITLAGDHRLEVRRGSTDDVLLVHTPDGRAGISITVGPHGIAVHVAGGDLSLSTSGALSIQAEDLALHGRRSLALTTDGDASLVARGDLRSEARIQNIRARLGNVNVEANDDVRLDGERIRLNSPDLPGLTPRTSERARPPRSDI